MKVLGVALHAARGSSSATGAPHASGARPRRSALSRALGLLRAGTVVLLAWGVASAALLTSARSRAGEALLALGGELMQLPSVRSRHEARRLSVNGLTLFVRSGSSARPPADVIASFRDTCVDAAPFELDGAARRALADTTPSFTERLFDGVAIEETERGTALGCITRGRERFTLERISERLERFAESGDLASFGRLRYAWIEGTESGGSAVLSLWSDEALPLLDRFPAQGDAPGSDLPGVTRVPGGRRLLSAALDENALYVYEHRRAPPLDELATSYDRALERAGFASVAPARRDGARRVHTLRRDAHELVVVLIQDGDAVRVTQLSQR